ncbi:MAG: universal stress protein [Thermodesulfobacteriota bacterium]|nr:universal stress protein [Thermodesulfobacteriota bacterium]
MVPDIKKILFTTDLSKNARYAFNYAARLASLNDAGIVILHVIEDTPKNIDALLSDLLGAEKAEELRKGHEEDARSILIGKKKEHVMIKQALERFCRKADSELADTTGVFETDEIIVKRGNVVEEIISQVETSNCDMIVMAYHSRSMLAEALLGGKLRSVLKQAKKPVLLVPMPDEN